MKLRRTMLLPALAVALVLALAGLAWLTASGPAKTRPGGSPGPSPALQGGSPAPRGSGTVPVPPGPGPVRTAASASTNTSTTATGEGAAVGLAGIVVDARSGEPIPGARVASRPSGGGPVRGVVSGSDGRFSVRPLPSGVYEVMAVAEGYLVPAPTLLGAATIDPSAPATIVRLDRGLTIDGRVVDPSGAPAGAGVEITLDVSTEQGYAGSSFGAIRTDGRGWFSIRGVPAGSGYRLYARAPGFSVEMVDLPPVEPPAGISDVTVTLHRLAIRGRVTLGPSTPWVNLSEARIEVFETIAMEGAVPDIADQVAKVEIQGDGRFEVVVATPGLYDVRAAVPGRAASRFENADVQRAPAAAPEVLLVLEPVLLLAGRVTARSGEALPHARVTLESTDGRNEPAVDATGRFQALVREAPFKVSARCAGFVESELTGVVPGGAAIEIVLDPDKTAVRVSGRLRASGGRSLLGTVITIDNPDSVGSWLGSRATTTRVGAEGLIDLVILAPGTYTISFPDPIKDELRAWVRDVTLAPGGSLDLSFEPPAATGSISGFVRGAPPADTTTIQVFPLARAGESFAYSAARALSPDDTFSFASVPPGKYRVRAVADGGSAEGTAEVEADREARLELVLGAPGPR